MPDDHWIDAAEAARRLEVKPATLYAYVSRGLLTRRRHTDGRRSLFDPAEIAALHRRGSNDQAGPFAFTSAITSLGADRPFFRGRDALQLARTSSYESVAGWLWTGTDGEGQQPWVARDAAVHAAVAAQAALPRDVLSLDRLQLIVTTLGVMDPMRFNLDADAVVATARSLIAGMIDALPSVSRRKPTTTASVPLRLWPKLTARAPDQPLVDTLRAALILLADHELAASTVAARVAASVKADPYAVVAAALGVVGGPMHGGASLGAERLLAQMRNPDDAPRVIGERLREGDRIPGVGHAVYKNGDARGLLLFELLRAAAPRHPKLAAAEAALAEVNARGLPAPNSDFAVATLTAICDMPVGSGEAIFAIARTAGWIAHAMEEYTRRSPFRPRASYVGPDPEPAIT
ncbi:MAG TPA: citrate/2-methylcitrate synthase [Mycobacteriales bacterium]|nr:citrate/2-methylcitrate synthase [Mycobacteriales bacterium]